MHVMTDSRWRIGEVATATGVTVRTLRHYHELGLLVPSDRTGSGYRLYSDADVQRLHRHLARLDQQVRLAEQLRSRLARILELLDGASEPSGAVFIEAIEVMTRM